MSQTGEVDYRLFEAIAKNIGEKQSLEFGNNGGNNGGMESRIAKLEATSESTDKRLGLIEQDLRALSTKVDKYFILGLVGLIGLGAAGYSLYDKVFMMNGSYTREKNYQAI